MISLNWCKDYIDLTGVDPEKLATDITNFGVNVEKVITYDIKNLVVGKVIDCVNHPNSDHLHICQVDIGASDTIQIVCGAPNVRKDLKVIVALPGAILPGDFEIKKGVIRDVESNGMLCALFELGLEEKTEENYNKGIHELPEDAEVGTNPLAILGYDDTILELDIHKHRNNDCFYHIGFSYIIGAILNKRVKEPTISYSEITDNVNNYVKLDVKTSKCPYYLGKMARNVVIKESPDFIKKRLTAVGMRPINNVVDISNYVMLEYGQPMHFFDYDKLGNTVLVRDALDTEVMMTLDEKERVLSKDDIVITDGDNPVCIAGVMGGLNTEVDENTKNIFIESAIFDAVSIRNTANKLDLKSEASIRYGKGLNYEYTKKAIDRACQLLEKYADATILSDMVVHDELNKEEKVVTFKPNEINEMLGINISDKDMAHELDRLDFKYEFQDGKFIVTIPNRRLDIEGNVNDIAEEIGCLYGYHNLKNTLPIAETKKGEYVGNVKYRKMLSSRLRSLGLNEVKTYTLINPETQKLFNYNNANPVILPNPFSSDKSVIRTSILPSLLGVYEYNKTRKVNDVNIYEISNTYNNTYEETTKIGILMSGNYINGGWQNNGIKVDFYLIKGIVCNILDYMGLKNRYSFEKATIKDLHPGVSANIILDREVVGVIGKVNPRINKNDIYVAELSLNGIVKPIKNIKFKEVSKYPSIKKDVAFIVKDEVSADTLIDEIRRSGGRLLTNIDIFDVYTGQNVDAGYKSIAFNLTFQDDTRTLSDEEVTSVFENIINKVTTKFECSIRDK
ncbi:MAG: phenylalanine--tRNA ligase subunit beta [Bacilli bacterium]|nr:phenylalanine--tRNA ligase subunit beta [Bacilli bacterium]